MLQQYLCFIHAYHTYSIAIVHGGYEYGILGILYIFGAAEKTKL